MMMTTMMMMMMMMSYITHDQQRLTVSEMTTDCHELMALLCDHPVINAN